MVKTGSVCKSFEGVSFRVDYNNDAAAFLVNCILRDLPAAEFTKGITKTLDLLAVGRTPWLSLWDGDKKLYHGKSRFKAAYTLMNAVLFYCIAHNENQHALHAGAVCKGKSAIILPGCSGSGKTTLTAWLLTRGYSYLTDELVMLSREGQIRPFPRPLSFKEGGVEPFLLHLKNKESELIIDEDGAMVPHRLLNPEYRNIQPMLSLILYPRFQQGTETIVEEVSPARSCLELLKSHVNGRNLDDLGIKSLSAILRSCRSYRVTYGKLDTLQQVFKDLRGT